MHFQVLFSLLFGALLATLSYGQETTPYLDPVTNISFHAYRHPKGFLSAYVLPQQTGTDFIAQLVVPLKSSAGYGALTLGSGMIGHLIVAAWPDGTNVMTAFRVATGRSSPPVWSGAASMKTIKSGTFVNSTHLSYTFVCVKCFSLGSSLVFSQSEEFSQVGWAMSTTTPSSPKSSGATLSMHSAGYGMLGLNTKLAKSAKYDAYAAMAV